MAILFKHSRYTDFGRMLADIATLNGVRCQSELAKAIRSNSTHVHSVMMGKALPNAKFIKKLKLNLECSPKEWKALHDEALKLCGWEVPKDPPT